MESLFFIQKDEARTTYISSSYLFRVNKILNEERISQTYS